MWSVPKCSYDQLCVAEFLDWSTLWVHCRGFGWSHIYTTWSVQTLFWFQFQLWSGSGLKWAGLDYSAAWQTLDIVCVHYTKMNNLNILPILTSCMFHGRNSYRFVMKWGWDSDDTLPIYFLFCLNCSYDMSYAMFFDLHISVFQVAAFLNLASAIDVEVTTVCLCCGWQVQWFPAGGGLSLHGCRRDVLLDLWCDLFAPGLIIWLSPQAPSACLGLYVGLSIEHWGPITLQGPVRMVGFSLMTYSQKHISGHVAPLFLDLQSQACFIWLLHAHSWQYQPSLCEIAYHQSSNDTNTIRQNWCYLLIYF